MNMNRRVAVIAALTAAAVPLGAVAASATPGSITFNGYTDTCGQLEIRTLNNSGFDYSGDARWEGLEATDSGEHPLVVKEGPFEGEEFRERFHTFDVPTGHTAPATVIEFDEDSYGGEVEVSVWVQYGPEQKYAAAEKTYTVVTDCQDPEPEPTPTESAEPTEEPTDEESDGSTDEPSEDPETEVEESEGPFDEETGASPTTKPEDTVQVETVSDEKPTTGSLPVTGGALAGLVGAALIAVAGGGGALYLSRKSK